MTGSGGVIVAVKRRPAQTVSRLLPSSLREPPTSARNRECGPVTGTSDRLRYVLDGLTFPVDRWELIARAEHYGADAASLHDLHALPPRRYGSLTDVINAITDGRHR